MPARPPRPPRPRRPPPAPGVLVVDKPRGPTSHDVVARVRRRFGTREVGHAGTLDPMATGVLVVALGEATKLVPFLTADDKSYEARLIFGRGTDTLDEEGTTTEEAPVPAELLAALAAIEASPACVTSPPEPLASALATERTRREQVPPSFSAIRTNGTRAYELARRGEVVDLPPRPVEVRSFTVVAAGVTPLPWLDVRLDVAKGYYVRSAARDLAASLGTVAHLSRLRRLRSGSFTLDDVAFDVFAAEASAAGDEASRLALIPLAAAAARCLPVARLGADGERRARLGQPIPADEIDRADAAPVASGLHALLSAEDGALVAVAEIDAAGAARVVRGFPRPAASLDATSSSGG